MKAIKIYNNNIIAVLTDTNQVALVTGKGIGFNARVDDEIYLKENDKLFILSNPEMEDIQSIINRIDSEALEIARKIINKANELIDYPLFDSLLLQLADHISFKVEMMNQGIVVPNLLATEIKFFYPQEFIIGQYGVMLINEKYQTKFDDDEASYLALHILNSSVKGTSTEVYKITEFIREMMQVIQKIFQLSNVYGNWKSERLVIQLKFLAQRLLSQVDEEQDSHMKNGIQLDSGFLKIRETELLQINNVLIESDKLAGRLFGKKWKIAISNA